ncbi:MAG: aminoglycoside phosphotransferase family protein [Clostridia bacterium]|nr:aminoglycoside phosphotransferase family protein [Clostridia bacterium]
MLEIVSRFRLQGTPIGCVDFGSGHINKTYLVVTNYPHLYVLQNVNTRTFPDADGLMRNVILVTDHIRKKIEDPRQVLQLVPTVDDRLYILEEGNQLWRMYEYVTGSVCLDQVESDEDFRQAGKAFGMFQRQMADFPAEQLVEVIPNFHHTPKRYEAFHQAIEKDKKNRAVEVEDEINFFLEREASAGELVRLMEAGELPLRVTHNDTKLNNVMMDEATREPLCIVDLDTVMPGLAAYDFGDAIRYGASEAAEDERNLSKVRMSLGLYRAFAEGFVGVSRDSLTPLERETLPEGARLMTLECGMRFLTDYLQGDTYFHISRPEHNLDRARTQLTLVRDMENKWAEMKRIIREV